MNAVLKEPLLWFALAGATLFVLDGVMGGEGEQEIVITAQDVAHLQDLWRMQMRRDPTDGELEMLIEDRVREDVLVREAERLGLDRDDVIIRRRLVQKLEFLAGDVATAVDPSEDELRDWYAERGERYRIPPRVSFAHIYLSSESRETAAADAEQLLASVRSDDSNWKALGDPFMLRSFYADVSERRTGDLFGREFAASVFALPGDGWSGPVESAFGVHLVRIDGRRDAEDPPFEGLKERLLGDWRAEQAAAARDAWYDRLRQDYSVAVERE